MCLHGVFPSLSYNDQDCSTCTLCTVEAWFWCHTKCCLSWVASPFLAQLSHAGTLSMLSSEAELASKCASLEISLCWFQDMFGTSSRHFCSFATHTARDSCHPHCKRQFASGHKALMAEHSRGQSARDSTCQGVRVKEDEAFIASWDTCPRLSVY